MKILPTPNRFLINTAVGCTLAAAWLACGSLAQAQGYSTTFDTTEGYIPSATLSGQPQTDPNAWDTNDLDTGAITPTGMSIGQSDFVGILGGYSQTGTDNVGYVGGLNHANVVPGSNVIYLYHPFTLPAVTSYAFNVDFAIAPSQTPYTASDRFAWSFRNAAGTNLFSVDYVPVTAAGATTYSVHYSVNGGVQDASTTAGVLTSSIYHLTVGVNVTTNTFNITMTSSQPGSTALSLATVPLGTNNADSVTNVAATWILRDTTTDLNGGKDGAGGNALIFNNYGVTVPEPSTWIALALSVAAMLAVARRRTRA